MGHPNAKLRLSLAHIVEISPGHRARDRFCCGFFVDNAGEFAVTRRLYLSRINCVQMTVHAAPMAIQANRHEMRSNLLGMDFGSVALECSA